MAAIIAKGKWKVCSRGHRYHGAGPCPICWPGHYKRQGRRLVAFLRGINVGGKSVIKMAALKQAVEACGFENVATYIQSGNVLFESKADDKKIVKKMEAALKNLGLDPRVVIKTKQELAEILKRAPNEWKHGNDLRRYLAFVIEPKIANDVIKEIKPRAGVDSVKSGKGVVYMSTKLSGITKSGFSQLASKPIYKSITIRSYSTAQKLLQLMGR